MICENSVDPPGFIKIFIVLENSEMFSARISLLGEFSVDLVLNFWS